MSWYTWVFDGLGSTAVVAGCAALYRKYQAKRPSDAVIAPSTAVIAQMSARQSTQPTPTQINEQIKAVLPFDREHAAEKYKGLSVIWKVTFCFIESDIEVTTENDAPVPKKFWRLFCQFGDESSNKVGIHLRFTSLPPEIKLLKEGSIIWVQGTIRSIGFMSSVSLERDPVVLEVMHF
jgi:hypothetical protein